MASAIRTFTRWLFRPPYPGSVSASFAVDAGALIAYVEALADAPGPRVTLNHVVLGAVAHTLTRHPWANSPPWARETRDVGIVMPVNLLGHRAGAERELSFALVPRADRLSLRGLAEATRQTVASEREGKVANPFARLGISALERLPDGLGFVLLEACDRARRLPGVDRLAFALLPATTLVTNPGSVFADVGGVWVRGGAMTIPDRLISLPTVWGLSPVQREVVAGPEGPAVRPVLPVVLIFDHRVIDGVRAGQLIEHFSRVVQAPAEHFGRAGDRPIAGA